MARPSLPLAYAEWVLFRVALTILLALPRWVYVRFAATLGIAGYYLSARYRRIARKNLRLVWPERFPLRPGADPATDSSDSRLEAFIRWNYQHLFLSFMEGFLSPRLLGPTNWHHSVTVELSPAAKATLLECRGRAPGILMTTGHIGAWEMSVHPTALAGLPTTVVARPLDSYIIDADVNAMRNRHGNFTVSKFQSLTGLMRDIKNGRSLGLVVDQDAGVHARGVFVKFFGRWCKSVETPAVLSLRFRTPLIPAFLLRRGLATSYTFLFLDPIPCMGDAKNPADVQRMMQLWHDSLEQILRKFPEQFEWLHNKWRTRPPGEPGADPRFVDQQIGAEEKARRLGYYGG